MDDPMMLEALSLAEIGWGRVSPNPLVGAVVVKGDHERALGDQVARRVGAAAVPSFPPHTRLLGS